MMDQKFIICDKLGSTCKPTVCLIYSYIFLLWPFTLTMAYLFPPSPVASSLACTSIHSSQKSPVICITFTRVIPHLNITHHSPATHLSGIQPARQPCTHCPVSRSHDPSLSQFTHFRSHAFPCLPVTQSVETKYTKWTPRKMCWKQEIIKWTDRQPRKKQVLARGWHYDKHELTVRRHGHWCLDRK